MTFHCEVIFSLLEQKIQILVGQLTLFSYLDAFGVTSIGLHKFFLVMVQNSQLEIQHLVQLGILDFVDIVPSHRFVEILLG